MMTSQILKFLDFTKTQQFRYLENKVKNNEKKNYNQGLFYCKKNSFTAEGTFKNRSKVKKKKKKKKWLKKLKTTLKVR